MTNSPIQHGDFSSISPPDNKATPAKIPPNRSVFPTLHIPRTQSRPNSTLPQKCILLYSPSMPDSRNNLAPHPARLSRAPNLPRKVPLHARPREQTRSTVFTLSRLGGLHGSRASEDNKRGYRYSSSSSSGGSVRAFYCRQ